MMKNKLLTGFVLASLSLLNVGCQTEGDKISFSDPSILVDNGKYYMTATIGNDGFTLMKSGNLRHWTYVTDYILRKGEDTFGQSDFRSPRIVPVDNGYLLTYSADGKMCVAESKNIAGPYKQREKRPISDTPVKTTDTDLFRDTDGKWYMYHTRWQQQDDMDGNVIYVAEFDMENQRLKEETLTECIHVSEPWELTYDGMQFNHKTVENPMVMKRDSIYYMFYSANDYRSVDYAVGYAIAKSPYGPWEKHPGPMIHVSETDENGSGNGNFFFGLDKAPYYVYHVHQNDSLVDPCTVRIIPLKMPKHRVTGTFHITAKKKDNIIVPKLYSPVGE